MTKRSDPYFTPVDTETAEINIKIEPETPKQDNYFTPINDHEPLPVPDSIESKAMPRQGTYQFVKNDYPDTKTLKRLVMISIISAIAIFVWQAYTTLAALFESNNILGAAFSLLLVILVFYTVKAAYQFKQSQRKVAKTERLREQANSFISERSHDKSNDFIAELRRLYAGKPQQTYLTRSLQDMPDYLNDEEIINRLSSDFFSHLDNEAKQLITQHSVTTGTLVAVSQVAIVDSLIVLWRTLTMVNQVNSIYGLSLTRFGLWQFFMRIVKAALFSAGSQIGITTLIHKMTPGLSGSLLGALAQGLGMGTYVAKIGIEAMKEARPIPFTKDSAPDLNLIRNSVRQAILRQSESKQAN